MSTFGIIAIILGSVTLFIILFILLGLKLHPFDKGKRGEEMVSDILKKYIKEHGGYLINDVIIPGGNNKTSEIDHILFTIYGIFVIETKNTSGSIYGKEQEKDWTQVMGNGDIKHHMYNPVMQNQTHIYRLMRIIHTNKIVNLVVFNQNNTWFIQSSHVLPRKKLLKFLNEHSNRQILGQNIIDKMYNKVRYYVDNPIISKEDHIRRIHETHISANQWSSSI